MCSRLFVLVVSLLIVGVLSAKSYSQEELFDIVWTGAGDNISWNDGNNWEGGVAPGVNDVASFLFSPFGLLQVQVNQPTAVGGIFSLAPLSLELGADFSAGVEIGFGAGFGRGGSLNINSHTYSGGLFLGNDGFGSFLFQRDGGVLNLTGLSLAGDSALSPFVFDLTDIDSLSGRANVAESATLNINGASVDWDGDIDGGTVNLNSGTISGQTQVNVGGTLNINGGSFSGDLSLGSIVEARPTVSRTGGVLNLGNLQMLNGGELTIAPTDNITESINIAEGSELTVNRALSLTGNLRVQENSKVFLNGDLTAQQLIYDGDSFVRGDGAAVDVDLLDFRNAEYTYDGTDTFARAIRLENGRLNINQPAISQNGFINASNGSTVTVNAETTVGSGGYGIGLGSTLNINASTDARVIASGGSVVNINADLDTGPLFRTLGSNVNLNDGTLRGPLELLEEDGVASTFNRSSEAVLLLGSLRIEGETHVDILDGDSFIPGSGSISLGDGASVDINSSSLIDLGSGRLDIGTNSLVRVLQADGQLTGISGRNLTINDSGGLELVFDEELAPEGVLDFGLRLDFDQTDLLQGFLDSGRITFSGAGTADIDVIRDRDRFGDFTYVGYIGNATAIPEPGNAILLLSFGVLFRRNRRNQ